MQPDRINRGHAHQPGDLRPQRADAGLYRVVEFQHLAKAFEAGLSFRREHEALAAIDKLHAEMPLDPMDRLRGRRLADVVERSPAGEALVMDDIAEDAKVSMFIRASYHKGDLFSRRMNQATVKMPRRHPPGPFAR